MNILIIDDSGLTRKMIRSILLNQFPDATFVPAKNGKEGYERYVEQTEKDSRPDLVFIDQLMPEIDGMETMKKILEFDPDAYLVMVTANIQEPVRKQAIDIGARAFLNKPLNRDDFERVKQEWEAGKKEK